MAIIGTVLQEIVKRKGFNTTGIQHNIEQQCLVLKKLLNKAKKTAFGKAFNFDTILKSKDIVAEFQNNVPVYDYNSMYESWWNRVQEGESNICWPGKVKYFALTSGTSGAASKKIPITNEMINAIRKTGIRQTFALRDLNLPTSFFQKDVMMLGGSTNLYKLQDGMEGDLSGIMQRKLPFWFGKFYKPGKPIAKERDWNLKLNKITSDAYKWDIGAMAGVPAWIQLLMEKIIDHYQVANIHEIWPNFSVYVHGGVSFAPYRKSFEKLLGREIYYLETYLASEGFIAYQSKRDSDMQLVLDNGIFFEFIPFTEENFECDGQLKANPKALFLKDVKQGAEYAILLSTVAGAWRYLIGDTIRFTNINNFEIVICGRTKHYLSLCGEHLSVENMTMALNKVAEDLGIDIKEFTVAGIPHENLFAHKWYIGTNKTDVDSNIIKSKLDAALCELNDDYKVERKAALKDLLIEILPVELFYDYMRAKGKEGGQNKFPRVIGSQYNDWDAFVNQNKN